MAVTADGTTLYVAAFGSSAIGTFDTAALENDTFVPSSLDHIPVSGGGPSGLVLDEARSRLYVLTRFDDAVSVIDTTARSQVAHLPLHDPEPASVRTGRRFLYDAVATSSNGEAACASCHVFGDFDSLAWDLGNPDDIVIDDHNPFVQLPLLPVPGDPKFHPMKGPMTTQTLRGMATHGPMHWRGDRSGANSPGGDALDEAQAFKKFIVAFDGLLGRGGPIADADMQAFTDFILQVTLGQQITLSDTNAATVASRIALLLARAAAGDCDVAVKGTLDGEQRGWVLVAGGFRSDRVTEPLLSDTQLRSQAATPGRELTYTAVPPGSGFRVGVDRDEDDFFDRDELDAGSDPADPSSIPPARRRRPSARARRRPRSPRRTGRASAPARSSSSPARKPPAA